MNVSVQNKGLKIGILLAYVVMVTVNALATLLPINGVDTAQVSAQYDTLFTPAGYAFSIWGAIYLLLGIYVVFQLLPVREAIDPERQSTLNLVGIWFIVSSMLNSAWIFTWHYQQLSLSVIVMLLLLLSLIRIGWLLRRPHCKAREELALRAPFGLYFGWITVATIANISVWLVSRSWNGFGIAPQTWTIILLSAGVLIAGFTMIRTCNFYYGLSVTWAYAAILVRHLSADGYASQYPMIITFTAIALCALVALLIVAAIHTRKVAACKVP